MTEELRSVYDVLDQADETVRQLHAGCCEPVRALRIEAVAATLESARSRLDRIGDIDGGGATVIAILEDAGAQLGGLQIGCCAPARTQLYAKALESLTKAQLGISRSIASGHFHGHH